MNKEWIVSTPDPDQAECIGKGIKCHPITAGLLVNRGITDTNQAERFIRPSLSALRKPSLMQGISEAVERVIQAIAKHEWILIFGDYDADGVTSTVLLLEFLKEAGANALHYIPDRFQEGYGLKINHIIKVAVPNNVRLIITVDCGINSVDAVKEAADRGIDVIITDHHEAPDTIPNAYAVIDPKHKKCSFPFSGLAGVGVALFFVIALRSRLREKGVWQGASGPNLKTACDLVALGTIADMAPLLEENRILVKAGLEVLCSLPRPGIKALMDISGIAKPEIEARDVAFMLAPRINAAGRLANAESALKLLTAPNYDTALTFARFLDETNRKRQEIEKTVFREASKLLAINPSLLQKRSIVVWGEGWNEGVIGIVASRLVSKYHRPVILISVKNGTGKGSARSIEGFNICEGLNDCSECLDSFGGHEFAAGLSLSSNRIKAFEDRFEKTVHRSTEETDFVPKIKIDCAIRFSEIDETLIDEIELFAPFGAGNPEPLFASYDVDVIDSQVVGRSHLRMTLKQAGCTAKPFS
ncbi:MAG: single-stranded-DNA-specific exonuclease RecJ, partial [Pseudomonadota bacterium]